MYLDTAHILEATVALLAAIVILVAAYAAPLKVSVGILLVLIPFQLIDTSYGSVNILMTYVLIVALMLRGRLRYAPMLGAVLAVLIAYLISMSQVNKVLYLWHGLQIFFIVSGFLVFILAYNLAREVENPRFIINLLITSNVMAVIYCFIQFGVGPGEYLAPFGIDEISMHRNRGSHDPRLVGPFGTPGITAAYFMSMTLILTYEVIHSRSWRKILLILLCALNLAMIVATGSRGSFLVLIVGLLGFMYVFRAQLGLTRIIQILLVSAVALVAVSAFVVNYTDFGTMLNRLQTVTDLQAGVPQTRYRVWQKAWEHIPDKPFLGHGPALFSERQAQNIRLPPGELRISHPHNLYLYLLVTVGIVGATCMLWFLFRAVWRVYQGAKRGSFSSDYERGWVFVGVLVLGTFLVDQLKQEFIRYVTTDYVHFVFATYGIFLGWADRARMNASSAKEVSTVVAEPRPSVVPALPAASGARAKQHGQRVPKFN